MERKSGGVAIDFEPGWSGKPGSNRRPQPGKVALYQLSYSRVTLRLATAVVAGTGKGLMSGVPWGVRTPVTAVKGQCPRPLDEGDA